MQDPPNKPEKDIPTKPDVNPDPTKPGPANDPSKIDPTRIEEPGKVDPTRINPPPVHPPNPPREGENTGGGKLIFEFFLN